LKKRIYTRPVSVTLPESIFQQIFNMAEEKEVSMSEVIREAIREKLEVEPNVNRKLNLMHRED